MDVLTVQQRIEGGFFGLLVGDALGVPYEFHHSSALPDKALLEMDPPKAPYHRAHINTPVGTWSDDGAQALCLASSLLERDCLDIDDLAIRFINWLEDGYMSVDGRAFDCGRGTREAIDRMKAGVPPSKAGGNQSFHNGNGAMMRILPLVLWHKGDVGKLIDLAKLQCMPTHRHPISLVSCAIYCVVARFMLHGATGSASDWEAAIRAVIKHHAGDVEMERAMKSILSAPCRQKPSGTGYIVDQLWTAQWALGLGDYEEIVKSAIALGNDTDTTACIVGGLVGMRDGVDGIPQRWRDALRGKDKLTNILQGYDDRETTQAAPVILPAMFNDVRDEQVNEQRDGFLARLRQSLGLNNKAT